MIHNDIENIVNIPTETTCIICYEPIGKEKTWKCKQCSAIFHKKCIVKWIKSNIKHPEYFTCPLCNYKYVHEQKKVVKKTYVLLKIIIIFGLVICLAILINVIGIATYFI